MTDLVIVGAGGKASEALDVIDACTAAGTRVRVTGVVADGHVDHDLLAARGIRYLGPVSYLIDNPETYFVAIADGAARARIVGELEGRAEPIEALVHPSAAIGFGVTIGSGVVIGSHVSVMNRARIGNHVHIGVNATVGHSTVLEDFTSVLPLASVSGDVHVGAGASIGSGAVVIEKLSIGTGAVVGAGAAVVDDVAPHTTVVGVPARSIAHRGG